MAFFGFQVSAKSWDHNEFFAQFSGDHTLLTKGYSVLLHKLSEGLEIHTNCPVGSLLDSKNYCGLQHAAQHTVCSPATLLDTPVQLLINASHSGVVKVSLKNFKYKKIHKMLYFNPGSGHKLFS